MPISTLITLITSSLIGVAPNLCDDAHLNAAGEPIVDSTGQTLSRHCEWTGSGAPLLETNICCSIEDDIASCNLARSKAHADVLASLTMREIWGYDPRGSAGLPPLRPSLYERAARLHGEAFDSLVFDVLLKAACSVQTRHLRARLGGPRWKVKSSLERLCAEGFVVREGATSDTYYRLFSSDSSEQAH